MTRKILVEHLVKKYGDNTVLSDINASIDEDDIVCVVGPSSSGKSTFLRCLSQLEEVSSGDIIVNDVNLTDRSMDVDQVRQHIGMVPQRFNLFLHLSILKNIVSALTGLGRLSKDEAEKKALELLERVGLIDKKDVYPGSLSGGQKQRVAITRVLAMNPDIMLFDEPIPALDPEMVGDVLGIMKDLTKQGITMVTVTYGMGFAKEAANRVVFIDGGNFLGDGSPEQVFKSPQNPQIKDFLDKILNI